MIELKKQIIEYAQKLNSTNLSPLRSGNVSLRVTQNDVEGFLLTPSGKRYEEDPNKYLSSFQQDVKATQFEPEVKAALEKRGVTDISGVDTMGRFKAFAAEQPIKSNLQRMAGSVEPFLNTWGIGNNLNYANGGLIRLFKYGGFLG